MAGKFRKLLACWGNGDYGRLGHGVQCLGEELPRVVLSLSDSAPASVACGFAHTAVVGGDGSVYTFGLNDAGQLGHSHEAAFTPEPLEMLLPEGVMAVAAGSRHTLMLGESGDVWAVGSNASGQLGLGLKFGDSSPTPRRISALAGASVSHIAAGAEHSLAVTQSGELLTWGAGGHGQLGHGAAAIPRDRDEHAPRLVNLLRGHPITRAAAGLLHSGCVDKEGNAWMWGDNRFWQLGVPISRQSSEPSKVDLRGVEQMAMSGNHSLALRHTGEMFSWGANEHGVLGLGKQGRLSARQPTRVPRTFFQQVACGWKHCAAVTGNGQLYTWGWGGSEGSSASYAPMNSAGGQLGLGNDFDYWNPTAVAELLHGDEVLRNEAGKEKEWSVTQADCGLNHTAAIVELAG